MNSPLKGLASCLPWKRGRGGFWFALPPFSCWFSARNEKLTPINNIKHYYKHSPVVSLKDVFQKFIPQTLEVIRYLSHQAVFLCATCAVTALVLFPGARFQVAQPRRPEIQIFFAQRGFGEPHLRVSSPGCVVFQGIPPNMVAFPTWWLSQHGGFFNPTPKLHPASIKNTP